MNRHQQEAKKYLSQAFGLNQRIESKLGQIEDLHDLATKATVTYSDMPKSPNRDGSRMEDAIIKIIDLENEINQDMMKLVELKKDIIRRIKAVESAELQTKDERAVAEHNTVAAFSMGKKVERCQGNRSIHALIPDVRS